MAYLGNRNSINTTLNNINNSPKSNVERKKPDSEECIMYEPNYIKAKVSEMPLWC